MKRIYLIIGLLIGLSVSLQGQSYTISNSTGTESEYDYRTSGIDVLTVPSSEVLSGWRSLPFSFNFFGVGVAGYYVSDNGYITFDDAATTSFNSNTAIPDVGGPNNAIYAFWDDVNVIAGGGSADRVTTWTYGNTPNRVHVIQWYSVTPASGAGFLYATIRLYECGDFDVVNAFGTATGMSATIGCENADGSLGVQVSGSPSLDYPLDLVGAQDDDVIYTFLNTGIGYDIHLQSIDFDRFAMVGSNTISGTVRNLGANVVTNFDLKYTVDGGAPVSDNISGVSIAPGATYDFAHSTPWEVADGGLDFALCVYTDTIDANPDGRACNNQICMDLFSNNGVSGNKNVLVEEFTGSWCGWCTDGAVVLDNILAANPDDVWGVSVHDDDDMSFFDGIRTGFSVSAYPNAMVDRYVFNGEPDEPHSRGAWANNTTERLSHYTPVNVSISTNAWNAATREISITAEANFVDFAAGDQRFVVYITEDSVVGSGSGYDQTNYLNTSTGHPYFGAGDPIIGFVHNHVLRALPGGAMGNAGVIPAAISPGETYSESFTYTLPASYRENKIKLVAAVAKYSTTIGERFVNNVFGEDLNLTMVGIAPEQTGNSLSVYPNPNSGNAMLKVTFTQATYASITVFDAFGKKVADLAQKDFASGESQISMDLSMLTSGLYFVKVHTATGTITEKIALTR